MSDASGMAFDEWFGIGRRRSAPAIARPEEAAALELDQCVVQRVPANDARRRNEHSGCPSPALVVRLAEEEAALWLLAEAVLGGAAAIARKWMCFQFLPTKRRCLRESVRVGELMEILAKGLSTAAY